MIDDDEGWIAGLMKKVSGAEAQTLLQRYNLITAESPAPLKGGVEGKPGEPF